MQDATPSNNAPTTEEGWSALTKEQRITVASHQPSETLARLERYAALPDAPSIVLHALIAPSAYLVSPHHRASKLLNTYGADTPQARSMRALIAAPLAEAVPQLYLANTDLFAHMATPQREHCERIAQAKPGMAFERAPQPGKSTARALTARGIKPFQLSQGSRDGGASR